MSPRDRRRNDNHSLSSLGVGMTTTLVIPSAARDLLLMGIREERLDQARHSLGLIVMQHVPGVCDDLEPTVANVCQSMTNDVESVAIAIDLRPSGEPTQDVGVGGRDP